MQLVTTILDVQPRVSGGSGAKSNDDIAYELCESILEKIKDKLDLDDAKPELFEPDSKGRMTSLTTVLVQEVDRFNKLLKVVKVSRSLPSLMKLRLSGLRTKFLGSLFTLNSTGKMVYFICILNTTKSSKLSIFKFESIFLTILVRVKLRLFYLVSYSVVNGGTTESHQGLCCDE